MKVVITGASGNIGTALLRVTRDWEVVGVARRPPDVTGEPYAGVRWVTADVGTDAHALRRAFEGADAVVNLAWAIDPNTDEPPMDRTNASGSGNVLDAVVAAGVPHVVCGSSIAAYGPADRWRRVAEDWPCTGIADSAYSAGKAALEKRLDEFEHAHPDVLVTRFRPCAVGQGDAATQLTSRLLSPLLPTPLLARRWLPVPLWRDLRLQLVHADDVARAIRLMLERRAGGAFNLAAEPVLPAQTLAEAFGGVHLPVPLPVLSAPAWAAWRLGLQPLHPAWLRLADEVPLVETTRARVELGWQPRRGAVEVLHELADAMRADHHAPAPPLHPRRRLRLGRPTHQSQHA
ncbi:NAD-dependent epimerase/dehydratase family protein [Saccharothrix obliqua]|uniref:NAD-dependent epimerase/dehydratase family protein n=1 Tax=Saccharothrix obliqua TaxID=2861747 RepID=UPI001C5EADD3|nr:NAD-dependent epimerase/dehydratase family protein [Saccharothrix obliqua]MBW4720332.1 NAD-dependent epimerase/dehydratase family protein [Saccharothrix obliqua]